MSQMVKRRSFRPVRQVSALPPNADRISSRIVEHLIPLCETVRTDVQSLFDHYEPSRHRRALSRRQSIPGQPRANARRLPGLFRSSDPQHRHRHGNDFDALGHATVVTFGRTASDQHSQHILAALAWLAEAPEPLLGAVQQLRWVRSGAQSRDQEEGCRLARTSMMTGRLRRSLASGLPSKEIAAPSPSRYRGHTPSMAS